MLLKLKIKKLKMKSILIFLLVFQLFLFSLVIFIRNKIIIDRKVVALVTDIGDIDDGGFNQASWDAIQNYCKKKRYSCEYYRPANETDVGIFEQIKIAVKNGAEIVICPGFKFMSVVDEAQRKFKNVHFVLLDSETTNKVSENNFCVKYEMEISGFLAGYAVAQDLMGYDIKNGGVKKNYGYGYCGGMANSGVYPFGFGYIQGIIRGTKDFVEKNKCIAPFVTINYNYANVFSQDDNTVSRAKGWFMGENEKKIDVIFVCGGKLYQSIVEAVTYCNKNRNINLDIDADLRKAARWIGVDTDQRKAMIKKEEKLTCYTSALKNLDNTITTALDYHFSNSWNMIGGEYNENQKAWIAGLGFVFRKNEIKNIQNFLEKRNYVGIPVNIKNNNILDGFFNFTINDYREIENNIINNDKYKIFSGIEKFKNYGGDKDKNKGNPNFMNKNKDFINKFLDGYDKFNIIFY